MIQIPESTKRPQVPVRIDKKLIYPTGVIRGRYFTEEVKAWIKLGYEVTIEVYHEYSYSENIFDDYIKHFYALKADLSLGSSRFLNKLLLNGL